jgi:foldase protein PrsA
VKYVMALGAFFVAVVALSGCGSSVPSNAIATVDGNPITLQAYNHWMFIEAKGQSQGAAGVPTIVPNDPPNFTSCIAQVRQQIPSFAKTPDKQVKSDCKQLFTSVNAMVLGYLIESYWYELEAHRLHIKVTQAQVMQAFVTAKNQQFKTAAEFTAFLKQSGQTLNDILFRVRANKIFTILTDRHKVPVTAATIAAYYHAHATQFGTPQTRNIRIVRTNALAPALAARSALLHGQSWNTVAKKYSVDTTTKANGGLLTGVAQGQEETALNNAAFAAPVNTIEGPVHGTFGYYVFDVIKITPGTQQTLAQASPLIKQFLTGQQTTAAQKAVQKLASARWRKLTHCRAAYYMAECGGKPPPTPKTTPTVQTAPTTTPTTATATTPTSAASTPSTTPTTGTASTPTSAATTPTTATSSTPTTTVTVPTTTTTPATSGGSTRSSPKKKK